MTFHSFAYLVYALLFTSFQRLLNYLSFHSFNNERALRNLIQ